MTVVLIYVVWVITRFFILHSPAIVYDYYWSANYKAMVRHYSNMVNVIQHGKCKASHAFTILHHVHFIFFISFFLSTIKSSEVDLINVNLRTTFLLVWLFFSLWLGCNNSNPAPSTSRYTVIYEAQK